MRHGLGSSDTYGGYRARLAETLRERGIADPAVLHAVSAVPRHLFVPDHLERRAYEDVALPIGGGQTISQPFVQARSIEALGLRGGERVLEIGTGSGYQTALLARIAGGVVSVERIAALADRARAALVLAGVRNASVMVGDGSIGWRPLAPYAGIIVSAASPDVPAPLVEQLAVGGRLVVPVGDRATQRLTVVERTADGPRMRILGEARFVPLLGEFGFV